MLLPFRSAYRKLIVMVLVPAGLCLFLLFWGCPPTSQPTSPPISSPASLSDSAGVEGVMPRSLGEAPRRPLVVLLPGKDEWQEPPDPELTELGPPQRSVERQREPEMYWGCLVHRVRAGENLSRIAEQYYGQEKYAAGLQQFNPQAFNENQALLADKLIYLPTEPLRRRDGSRKAPAVRPDFYITRAGDSWSTIARDLLGSAGEAEQLRKLNFHLSAGVKPLPSGIKIKLK